MAPVQTLGVPTCWDKDRLWFEDTGPQTSCFDMHCFNALVGRGIGAYTCPTLGDWAGLSIGASLVLVHGDECIIPLPDQPFARTHELQDYTWERLWEAADSAPDGSMTRDFIAGVFRLFLPRHFHAPPERPYHQSNFVQLWEMLECADNPTRSLCNITQKAVRRGEDSYSALPGPVQASIDRVVDAVPLMLQAAEKQVRSRFHW